MGIKPGSVLPYRVGLARKRLGRHQLLFFLIQYYVFTQIIGYSHSYLFLFCYVKKVLFVVFILSMVLACSRFISLSLFPN